MRACIQPARESARCSHTPLYRPPPMHPPFPSDTPHTRSRARTRTHTITHARSVKVATKLVATLTKTGKWRKRSIRRLRHQGVSSRRRHAAQLEREKCLVSKPAWCLRSLRKAPLWQEAMGERGPYPHYVQVPLTAGQVRDSLQIVVVQRFNIISYHLQQRALLCQSLSTVKTSH